MHACISPLLSFSIKSECHWDWAVCLLWLGINRALHSHTRKAAHQGTLDSILHYRLEAISLEILYIQPEQRLRSLQFTKIGSPKKKKDLNRRDPTCPTACLQRLIWLGRKHVIECLFGIYKPMGSWSRLVSLLMLICFVMLEVKIIISIRPRSFESC